MTSKYLKIIQTISKVCKIASQIGFILCCVGAGFCVVGGIGLAAIPDGSVKVGGMTIMGLIQTGADKTIGTAVAGVLIGLVSCVCGGIVCKFSQLYFKHELEAGTPFTHAGAKELFTLSIISIVLPIVAVIVSQIIYAITNYAFDGAVADMHIDDFYSISIGIFFMILSVVFHYGAELSENR